MQNVIDALEYSRKEQQMQELMFAETAFSLGRLYIKNKDYMKAYPCLIRLNPVNQEYKDLLTKFTTEFKDILE